ncbi:MAG: hypothetical protein ABIF87_15730 [Pseudomonadota bacterium]
MGNKVSPWGYIIIGSLLLAVGGILCGYGWSKFTEREPILSAVCTILDRGDPCSLSCVVTNSGRGEAKDIRISFEKMLPLGTKLIASPETGIKLEESQTLPNPIAEPKSATLLTAFSVIIPRIASNDSVSFKITTTHPVNLNAGEEVIAIHKEIVAIMAALLEGLSKAKFIEVNRYDIKAAEAALYKLENFYKPGKIAYEKGRQKVQFITDEEKTSWDEIRELWFKYEPIRKKILEGRPTLNASKVLIKTDEGEGYYVMLPPYVSSSYDFKASGAQLKEIMEKGLDVLSIGKERLTQGPPNRGWKQPSPAKQALIDEHNAVAKTYEDKHLYFVPLMRKSEFDVLPQPLKKIFQNKAVMYHQVEGGVIVSLYKQVEFAPDKQEWVDTGKGYWVFVSPEFRRWQKEFHERLKDLAGY